MSTNFPGTGLDTLTNPTSTDAVATVDHAAQHANANDAIEALEAKVGVNGSAVTTSHDYKLSTVTSTDKVASQDGTQTLTNKTLTSPVINTPVITGGNFTSGTMVTGIINGTTAISLGQDATGDIYYRNASGNIQRLAIGSNDQILKSNGTTPTWGTTAGVPTVQSATGGTLSLTTTAGQTVIVWASGVAEHDNTAGVKTFLKYGGVTKHETTTDYCQNGLTPFALQYTEQPGAATANITLSCDNSKSIIESECRITALIF